MNLHRFSNKVFTFVSAPARWVSERRIAPSSMAARPERRPIPEASPALREAFKTLTTSEQFSEDSVRKAFAHIKP